MVLSPADRLFDDFVVVVVILVFVIIVVYLIKAIQKLCGVLG